MNYYGINLHHSSNNSVNGNSVTANNASGIELNSSSSNNNITGNDVRDNGYGIEIYGSSGNRVFHNNFVNNTEQARTDSVNAWDDDYPSGGNYWSDYNDTDLLGGPNQNETYNDSIGDARYIIDANSTDNYPLMGTSSDFNVTIQHHVQTVCNSTITDFQFNGTAITFNIFGEDGTKGFCRISIPKALMNSTYKVFVNGTEVAYTLLPCFNCSRDFLYFAYNHSTQEVIIIPEFPLFHVMQILVIAMLISIIIYGRKRLG